MGSQCKQCYYYARCKAMDYPYTDDVLKVTITSIENRRETMSKLVDCFISPQQHKRDVESAKKSQIKQGIYKGDSKPLLSDLTWVISEDTPVWYATVDKLGEAPFGEVLKEYADIRVQSIAPALIQGHATLVLELY